MLAGGYSWRLFFYVEFAFAMALFILAFFFVEETTYKRVLPAETSPPLPHDEKLPAADQIEASGSLEQRKSFLSTLKPWSSINHDAQFFMTALRSFTYYLVPSVFWVVTTYGELIFFCI